MPPACPAHCSQTPRATSKWAAGRSLRDPASVPAMSQNLGNLFGTHSLLQKLGTKGNILGLPGKSLLCHFYALRWRWSNCGARRAMGCEIWAEGLGRALLSSDPLESKGGNPTPCRPGKQTPEGACSLDSTDPPQTWTHMASARQSRPASLQQLRCFKGLSSLDSSCVRWTLPSAWAPKGRSLISLTVRFPLISLWEFSSTDALSSGIAYFTEWYNYAWSLATGSNSLRCNNSLPSQKERTPKSLLPSLA